MTRDDDIITGQSDNSEGQESGPLENIEIFDEEYVSQIEDFLEYSGAALVLDALEGGPARFIELEEELPVSQPTIVDRIDDMQELNLTEVDIDSEGHKIHKLTDRGTVFVEHFQRRDLVRIRREIRRLEAEYKEQVSEFGRYLLTNKDDIDSEVFGRFNM